MQITPADVRAWFTDSTPAHWRMPSDSDISDIAGLLSRCLAPDENEDDGQQPVDRWKDTKAAAAKLSTEIPAMLALARAAVLQAEREGVECDISRADLTALTQLAASLKAMRPVLFKANLFQPIDAPPPRKNNQWHRLARLLSAMAIGAWRDAGVKIVGAGNKETSPVVKFVFTALDGIDDEKYSPEAITKVLRGRRDGGR
jgi:hypothetical protein